MERKLTKEVTMAILGLDMPNHDKVLLIAIIEADIINCKDMIARVMVITKDCRGTVAQVIHRLYTNGYLSWTGTMYKPVRKIEWEKIMGTTKGE